VPPRDTNARGAEVRRRLKALVDAEFREGARKYFKHEVKILGVRSGDVQAVGSQVRKHLRAAKDLDGALALAEALLKTGVLEEGAVAVTILQGFARDLGPAHYPLFDRWIGYCANWAITDNLCGKAIGPVMRDHGLPLDRLLRWTRSKDRWRRRAAAVCLIPSVRRRLHHDAAFEVADRLMPDEDDMVRKGVGWLLKVTADADTARVIEYLLRWKGRTSRLVLRYASEKMTPAERRLVLG
jgi:3-methyladenine DNA glycosylase AlkD